MKLFLYILCWAFCLQTFAQINIVNTSFKDTTKKEIYLSVDNELVVTNVDASKGNFELISKNKSTHIKKIGKAKFVVYNYDTLNVNKIDTLNLLEDNKIIVISPFIYKELCFHYNIQVGTKSDSVYSIKEILQNSFLKVALSECNFKINYDKIFVQRFNVEIATRKFLSKKYFEITGYKMTADLKNVIKQLNAGDKLIISNIKIVGNILCPTSIDDKIIITVKN